MIAILKTPWDVLRKTLKHSSEDKLPKLAAALAYYSSFALAPLLVVAVAVAGFLFGSDSARDGVLHQIRGLVGEDSATAMGEVLDRLRKPHAGLLASIIGGAALLFGASGVFGELQDSLNIIWRVKKKPGRGLIGTIKDRFFSLTMVLGVGFLLLVSLVVSAGLAALGSVVGVDEGGWLLKVAGMLVSFLIVSGLFALLFKYLPDAETPWRPVLIGGAATALLFTLGKFLIGLYLAKSTVSSTYGAAGAFLLVLLWIFYSSQIFFLGSELTHTLALQRKPRPHPDSDAVPVDPPRPRARSRGLSGA